MKITISIGIEECDDAIYIGTTLAVIIQTLSRSPDHATEIAQQLKQSVEDALTADSPE
ncbi:MAG: hypothetical protein KME13_20450 [Myxacorys californica WJT36-NPBG1]|jgi:SepF-like predicted cell division protein (DUF552 family)|nr:hypothetical protein [Myxacorys californica WJT36-NPBG1]